MKKSKIDLSIIICGILIILFILWSILVLNGSFLKLDYIFLKINHLPPLTTIFKLLTKLGSAIPLLIIIIITLLLIKNKYIGVALGINAFSIYLINLILKNIFIIPRPNIISLIYENGYAYPSGHAMASLTFYGYVIYLLYKKLKPSIVQKMFIIIFSVLILLIVFSRIYLGVHHFSDIIGGYLISGAYLIIFIKITNKLGKRKNNEIPKEN